MERQLQRLAQKLDSLDEASLMDLWSKYATIASHFEPTRQWEDSVLVFALIQAKHWKNLLFNYNWMQQTKFAGNVPPHLMPQMLAPEFALQKDMPDFMQGIDDEKSQKPKKECRVLKFVKPDAKQSDMVEKKQSKTEKTSQATDDSGDKKNNEKRDTPK